MTALTADRNTPYRAGEHRVEPLAAATKIFSGALLMRNAAGYLTKGATATACFGVGRAEATVDNTSGAAGALSIDFTSGVFRFVNFPADLISQGDVGKLCYIVDDQTVAKTDGAATRSRAGVVDGVDATGVWVRMDEAVTRGA